MKTKNFIAKANKYHNGKYDYSNTLYVHSMKKVKIICPIHGEFEQSPNGHLTSKGCKKCGIEKRVVASRDDLKTFLEKAYECHGETYSYDKVNYVRSLDKVTISCRIHGDFAQTPNNHLTGNGCPSCKFDKISAMKRFSKEDFVIKAKETHGEKYDYSKVVYVNSISDVEIICKEHGSFWQKANNHIFNKGCPSCAITGYRPYDTGYLYIMQCGDVIKIGITNLTPEHRSKDISRSYGHKFQVIMSWKYENGSIPDKVETTILRHLRNNYSKPDKKFEGSSECFMNVDITELITKINIELESYNDN